LPEKKAIRLAAASRFFYPIKLYTPDLYPSHEIKFKAAFRDIGFIIIVNSSLGQLENAKPRLFAIALPPHRRHGQLFKVVELTQTPHPTNSPPPPAVFCVRNTEESPPFPLKNVISNRSPEMERINNIFLFVLLRCMSKLASPDGGTGRHARFRCPQRLLRGKDCSLHRKPLEGSC